MAAIKFRDNAGIKIDAALKKEFPAVFSHRRSTNVSDEYQMYRSDKVIELMEAEGLKLVEIAQERVGWSTRRQPHTQIHTMRFHSKAETRASFGVGDSVPEIIVMNSHDGRAVFRAMAGIFRLVCCNGMVVADQEFGTVKRRHYGEANAFEKVRDIIADMPRVLETVSSRVQDWSAVDMDPAAQIALARLCMRERAAPEWLLPEQVLEARRPAELVDSNGHRDLWTTFNVLQEGLTNSTINRLAGGEGRSRSVRPINAAWGNVNLNQRLWATAEMYFEDRVPLLPEETQEALQQRWEARKAARVPVAA